MNKISVALLGLSILSGCSIYQPIPGTIPNLSLEQATSKCERKADRLLQPRYQQQLREINAQADAAARTPTGYEARVNCDGGYGSYRCTGSTTPQYNPFAAASGRGGGQIGLSISYAIAKGNLMDSCMRSEGYIEGGGGYRFT